MINLTNYPKTPIDLDMINEMARTHLFDIISFVEKKYIDEASVIANNIIYANKKFVLLAGPSSSGKTTTSKMISNELLKRGKNSIYLSLDDFFLDRTEYPTLENGELDMENFNILDLEEFNKVINELINNSCSYIPEFDFVTGSRKKEKRFISLTNKDIIIIEGIHALNPNLLEKINPELFYRIYVCVYTNFQINNKTIIPAKLLRLMRRMIRDLQARGTSIEETIRMWNNVCEGEEKYIKPYKNTANYIFDTTHAYEPLLYHTYLSPLLKEHLDYPIAKELYDKLELCGYLEESIVPDTSMLWEFLVKDN